jgi:hypothetical protein
MPVGSSMICLIERAQRPHGAIRPKYRRNSPVVRGGTLVAIAVRTSWSLSTLQEQMITMVVPRLSVLGRRGACARRVKRTRRRARRITAQDRPSNPRSHPRDLSPRPARQERFPSRGCPETLTEAGGCAAARVLERTVSVFRASRSFTVLSLWTGSPSGDVRGA